MYVALLGVLIAFPREVDLWIGSNTVVVGIHPCSVYMACVIVVHQREVLVVVGRYVLKNCKLVD